MKKYQRLLEKDGELEVVAAVQNGYEAVMKTVLCQPDVILMDIEMKPGPQAWMRPARSCPSIPR